jgi:hypothetical protein
MVWPVDDALEMVRLFTEVAVRDPLSFLLVLLGTLLVVASMAVLGYLALGATADLVTPGAIGRPPERRV